VRYLFSLERAQTQGAFLREEKLLLSVQGAAEPLARRDELPLLGRHNVANALAASAAAHAATGLPAGAFTEGLKTARALPHRLEPVVERGGVLWVNDSKATNVAAARSAIESLTRPLVLLLGGKDKGEEFRELAAVFGGRVRHVVAYGAAGARIAEALSGAAPLTLIEGSFEDVLREAALRALPGDVVLLSPACSSFDMFRNYEQRGEEFTRLARTGS
jgi:UDP-N-acetylmuramoylalanine--D-glutamate ligase